MASRSIKKRVRLKRVKDPRTGQVRETGVEYWRARYRDDAGKEHARHFDRKVDAQRWLDEVTASVVTGAYVDPAAGRVKFAAYFAEWSGRQIWESGTRRAMQLAAGSVTFADVQMRALRRSHVEQWVKAMQTAPRGEGKPPGLAPGTIKTRFNNVRTVLRAAVRDRVIAADPGEGVSLPRVRLHEAALAIPTTAQVRALLDAAAERWAAFIAVCAFAGLRLGEAAALQVGDIDFLRRTIAVTRQVQRAGKSAVEIRPPKYGSERTVHVPDELLAMLAQHIALHCPGTDPARWLFRSGDGNPVHQNTAGHQWRRARSKAGYPKLRLHDLRHFYASGLKVSRIASDASFGSLRERALPAAQRAALRRGRYAVRRAVPRDLGCRPLVASGARMRHLIRLRWVAA
jgi:integrase